MENHNFRVNFLKILVNSFARGCSSSLRDMIECNVKDKVLKEELVTSINDNEFKIIDLLKSVSTDK